MILTLLTVAFTGLIAYLTLRFAAASLKCSGLGIFLELDWILEVTPAQVFYLMFVIQSALLVSVEVCSHRISNHSIITLDILYLVSILMLILFHNLKEAGNTPENYSYVAVV